MSEIRVNKLQDSNAQKQGTAANNVVKSGENLAVEAAIEIKPSQDSERNPSNWVLTTNGDADSITAVNSVTNKSFSGTVKEFSAFLRK